MSWLEWNKETKKKPLTQTLQETLLLYQNNYTIEQIAKKRKYKEETIHKQFIELITLSYIPVEEITSKPKEPILNNKHLTLKELKEQNPHYTYFEIKAILASYNAQPRPTT